MPALLDETGSWKSNMADDNHELSINLFPDTLDTIFDGHIHRFRVRHVEEGTADTQTESRKRIIKNGGDKTGSTSISASSVSSPLTHTVLSYLADSKSVFVISLARRPGYDNYSCCRSYRFAERQKLLNRRTVFLASV